MFCHNCGTQVAPDLNFCPTCGQSLAPAPTGSGAVAWTPPLGIHSQTAHWIGEGWSLVKADIGIYIVLALVTLILGALVPFVIQGPLTAGFFVFLMKRSLNRRAEFADLFFGFNFFIPTLLASLVISLFVGVGTLFFIIPGLVLAAMYKFTYLFIVDKRMDFWPAMEASRAVVKNDYFGFTMFLIVLVLINILGFCCFLVGILVSVPVTLASITVAYKEIVGFDPRTAATL